MSYGYSAPNGYRRMALFVHKVLQGNKPADMPVEQPTKFELVINLKTAKALGLTLPESFLLRADTSDQKIPSVTFGPYVSQSFSRGSIFKSSYGTRGRRPHSEL
jgi:hypothetical protein